MELLRETVIMGKLNVKTIIPYVEKPIMKEYLMTVSELLRFLDPDRGFAEEVISVTYQGEA